MDDVVAHSYNMLTACGTSLSAGSTMMGYSAVNSASNSVQVRRGSTLLSSGANFLPGETLHVTLSNTGGEYVFEADGGASFSGGGCSNRRSTASVALLQMPSSATGSVNIWAGYAGGQSRVSITNKFTLVGGSSPPTYEPSKAPTTLQTAIFYPITQTLTNVPTATFYAKTTTKQAFFTVVQQTLVTQLPILSNYISVGTVGSIGSGTGSTGGGSSGSGSLLTSTPTLTPTPATPTPKPIRAPIDDQDRVFHVHLQAGSLVISYNITIILERTTYANVSALSKALVSVLMSPVLVSNLKIFDPTTYSALTSLFISTIAPVVTVLQTAAPSFLPSQEPTYHPAVQSTVPSQYTFPNSPSQYSLSHTLSYNFSYFHSHSHLHTFKHIMSCPFLTCLVFSCPDLSCLVLSCLIFSYPVLPYPVLPCPFLPHFVLSCPALSFPALSYPSLRRWYSHRCQHRRH